MTCCQMSALVRDVHEYLVELPFEAPTEALDISVTYQDSCHLAHAQRISEAPRRVLSAIPGLRLVEMENPDRCCGAAGVYALTQAAMSSRLLDEKMIDAQSTGAEVIATANPGCLAQLEAGVRRCESPARVSHVIELLDRAYRLSSA